MEYDVMFFFTVNSTVWIYLHCTIHYLVFFHIYVYIQVHVFCYFDGLLFFLHHFIGFFSL